MYMLFRGSDGTIIEICKYHYKNDNLYYQKLMEIKKDVHVPKSEKAFYNKDNKQSNK